MALIREIVRITPYTCFAPLRHHRPASTAGEQQTKRAESLRSRAENDKNADFYGSSIKTGAPPQDGPIRLESLN